jgi:hypothetical protein
MILIGYIRHYQHDDGADFDMAAILMEFNLEHWNFTLCGGLYSSTALCKGGSRARTAREET